MTHSNILPSGMRQSVTLLFFFHHTIVYARPVVDGGLGWAARCHVNSSKSLNMFFCSQTQNLYKTLSISELAFQDATCWYNAIYCSFFTKLESMQDVDWCMDWAELQDATSGNAVNLFFCFQTQNLYKMLPVSELAFQGSRCHLLV